MLSSGRTTVREATRFMNLFERLKLGYRKAIFGNSHLERTMAIKFFLY